MNKDDVLKKQKNIFGKLFLLSNRLQVVGDQILTGGMTIRQWLLTASIAQFGGICPMLSEVARLMGSSHQNVKQLALKLEEKGFLVIEKDEQDQRLIRLKLTEKSCTFWQKHQEEIREYLMELFEGFSIDEIDTLQYCLNKLYGSILNMEKSLKSQKILL